MSSTSSNRIIRYKNLRSDGTPNFSNRIYKIDKELERLARQPPVSISPTAPILQAIEKMHKEKVRSLVIVHGNQEYGGMLLFENIMNFLGGGELHDIVLNRHNGDLLSALNEPVKSLTDRNYPYVTIDSKLTDVISMMLKENISIVPVLNKDKSVHGVISEHDIVLMLADKRTGVKVKDVMSPLITVRSLDPLIDGFKSLIKSKSRTVFIRNEIEQLIGALTYSSIIDFIGTHKVFNFVKKGYISELISIPIKELISYKVENINEDEDVGVAASILISNNANALVVIDKNDNEVGMLTESDVFFSLAVPI